jgi:phosphohistidine phosphatase
MALVLDIMRHGEALPTGIGGDAARPLSPYGVMEVRALGARLAASGWRPDRVFASPLLRAQESAAHIMAALEPAPALEILDVLHPEGEPEDVIGALRGAGAVSGHVLLITHMPLVSRLSGFLGGVHHAFRTAELGRLECSELAPGGSGPVIFPGRPDSE